MQRDLFGGAVSCTIPASYIDVSSLRPVPDNQEVWNDVHLDRTLIIELLDREAKSNRDILQYVVDDLLEYQDARSAESSLSIIADTVDILGCKFANKMPFAQCASTVAMISKYKETARNEVVLLAAIIRLEDAGTDVFITHNVPLSIAPGSSSSAAAAGSAAALQEPGQSSAHVHDEKGRTRLAEERAFVDMVKTFTVHDWSLFDGNMDDS